jgi:hypothetical protein
MLCSGKKVHIENNRQDEKSYFRCWKRKNFVFTFVFWLSIHMKEIKVIILDYKIKG